MAPTTKEGQRAELLALTPDGGHGEKRQRVIEKLGAFFERFFGLGQTP